MWRRPSSTAWVSARIAWAMPARRLAVLPSVAAEASSMPVSDATRELHEKVVGGDRYSLARAITLVESTNRAHRIQAHHLMELTLAYLHKSVRLGISGYIVTYAVYGWQKFKSLRIGLSGSPGVGKSSFIETLGIHIIENDKRVAVLVRRLCLVITPSCIHVKGGGSLVNADGRVDPRR